MSMIRVSDMATVVYDLYPASYISLVSIHLLSCAVWILCTFYVFFSHLSRAVGKKEVI